MSETPEKACSDRSDLLSREVMDARNQMIKNANAVTALTAELRAMSRALNKQHSGLRLQSIISFVVALVVLWGAFHFVYRSRVEQLDLKKATLHRQLGAARTELERQRERDKQRGKAEKKALEFYQRLGGGQARAVIAEYPEVARLPLSKVESALFADWVQRKRSQLGYSSYADGMRAVGQQEYKEAVVAFRRSLDLLPDPPHAASLHYYRGIALMKLGSYLEASQALQRAIDHRAERLVSNQVRYHLAATFEMLDQRDRAKQAYAEFLKRYPTAAHAGPARRRLKSLATRSGPNRRAESPR